MRRELSGAGSATWVRLLEEALEHPDRFLVRLNAADREVLGFEIIHGAGGVTERDSIRERLLVGDDEAGGVVLGGDGRVELLDAGLVGKIAQAAEGVGIEGAHSLRDFVDRLEELLVLFLESLVEGEEAG